MSEQFSVEQITAEQTDRWNKLLYGSLYPSYRQSIAFEYSKESKGRKVNSFIFNLNGKDIAGVHYSIKRSKFNLLNIADILSGIVFKIEPTVELLDYIINHFISFATSNKVSYVRITPWLPKLIAEEQTGYELLFNQVLLNKGFDIINKGRYTYWIDLSKSEEELLKKMKRQTRYDVRQGLKSDIKTNVITTPDEKLINNFWLQYQNLANSKNFSMYSKNEFKKEINTLLHSNIAKLFVFEYQDTVINFSIASSFGIASYLHGAINLDFKKLKDCPSPGPLAQWVMISEMKNNGVGIYDMGFCPGPVPVLNHPAYNIWRFKYGFGGDHVEFLPTYGKVLDQIKGRAFKLIKNK